MREDACSRCRETGGAPYGLAQPQGGGAAQRAAAGAAAGPTSRRGESGSQDLSRLPSRLHKTARLCALYVYIRVTIHVFHKP